MWANQVPFKLALILPFYRWLLLHASWGKMNMKVMYWWRNVMPCAVCLGGVPKGVMIPLKDQGCDLLIALTCILKFCNALRNFMAKVEEWIGYRRKTEGWWCRFHLSGATMRSSTFSLMTASRAASSRCPKPSWTWLLPCLALMFCCLPNMRTLCSPTEAWKIECNRKVCTWHNFEWDCRSKCCVQLQTGEHPVV